MLPTRRAVCCTTVLLALSLVAACSGETSAADDCQVDTDCHGDRVCESGKCVDPDEGWTGPGGAPTSSSVVGGGAQTGTGGAAGPSSTTGPGPASASSSSASSGSGGSGGFAQATPLAVGDIVSDSLSPTGAEDFYVFSGTKGEPLAIYVTAQGSSAPFDPYYIDTVLTLYDASHQVVAENDDVTPRSSNDSELLTLLPATGQYYLRVTECWTWVGMPGVCSDPKAKTSTDYELALVELDPFQDGIVDAAEPDGTSGTANAMEYLAAPNGGYYVTLGYGTFDSGSDVDYFAFTLPFDVQVSQGRPVGYFDLMPAGASGNGSSTPPGLVAILDAGMGKVAEVDASGATGSLAISPPLTLGTPYFLRIEHPTGAPGANDFYVFKHYGAGSNPLELSDGSNGTLAGAEPLDLAANTDGTYSGFIEGDIATTADLDHFSAAVPAGAAHVSAVCGAQREGSGLRNFTLTLLQQSGTQIAADVESASAEASLLDVAIPATATSIVLRASSGTKAVDVSSTFYRCGMHFAP